MLFDLLDEMQISSYLNERENVVLDFYADWCAPCKKFMVTLEEMSNLSEYKHVTFIKVNVDRFGSLAGNYRITSIPTIIFLNKHRESKKLIGFKEKEQFAVELNDYFIEKAKTTKKPEIKAKIVEQAQTKVEEKSVETSENNLSDVENNLADSNNNTANESETNSTNHEQNNTNEKTDNNTSVED